MPTDPTPRDDMLPPNAPNYCAACERGDHECCGMQTWCECDCGGPDDGWLPAPEDYPLSEMPAPPPLWIGDAANEIVDNVRGWIDEADAEAAREQDSEAGDYFLLGKIEQCIARHWRADADGKQ